MVPECNHLVLKSRKNTTNTILYAENNYEINTCTTLSKVKYTSIERERERDREKRKRIKSKYFCGHKP